MNADHSITVLSQPQHNPVRLHQRLFLHTHTVAHQRLTLAYHELNILLSASETRLSTQQHLAKDLSALLSMVEPDHFLACRLVHVGDPSVGALDPVDFLTRFRFEYANHLFLRHRHRRLNQRLRAALSTGEQDDVLWMALQILLEADAANEQLLLAFEALRKSGLKK